MFRIFYLKTFSFYCFYGTVFKNIYQKYINCSKISFWLSIKSHNIILKILFRSLEFINEIFFSLMPMFPFNFLSELTETIEILLLSFLTKFSILFMNVGHFHTSIRLNLQLSVLLFS